MNAPLLDRFEIEQTALTTIVGDALDGAEDGELFVEERQVETIAFEHGSVKTAERLAEAGFGVRVVSGEATGYASSGAFSERSLRRAVAAAVTAKSGRSSPAGAPVRSNRPPPYGAADPQLMPELAEKIALLQSIDSAARRSDPAISEVSVTLTSVAQEVAILRPDTGIALDSRPLITLAVSVMAERDGRRERGAFTFGGRAAFDDVVTPEASRHAVAEAVRIAVIGLSAAPAPAGEMNVVLGPGWPGILIHEAIGHGLEGDINRKHIGAFSERMGERIAAPGVTVVDDGTLQGRRGSLAIDDEGSPSGTTVLIDDGILVGLMQDRKNARLMRMHSTGNGRRQSFRHPPMPRMTNTFMQRGDEDPAEIIASLKRGLYAVSFGGGEVDITSGKFVFSCTEAYEVEYGRIGRPVKGAVLIGNGRDALTRVKLVGNNMSLDPGLGQCGKYGQMVPVGVGLPTVRIDGLIVGGTG
jgi:TldD protein